MEESLGDVRHALLQLQFSYLSSHGFRDALCASPSSGLPLPSASTPTDALEGASRSRGSSSSSSSSSNGGEGHKTHRDVRFSSLYGVAKLLSARLTLGGRVGIRNSDTVEPWHVGGETLPLPAAPAAAAAAAAVSAGTSFLDEVVRGTDLSLDALVGFAQYNVPSSLAASGAASLLAAQHKQQQQQQQQQEQEEEEHEGANGTPPAAPPDMDALLLDQIACALGTCSHVATWLARRYDTSHPLGYGEATSLFPEPYAQAIIARMSTVARGVGAHEAYLEARALGVTGALVPVRGAGAFELHRAQVGLKAGLIRLRNVLAVGVAPVISPRHGLVSVGWQGSHLLESNEQLLLHTASLLRRLHAAQVGLHPLIGHRVCALTPAYASPGHLSSQNKAMSASSSFTQGKEGDLHGDADGGAAGEVSLADLELDDDIEEW